VVCNPSQNALLKAGNKSDRIDARKLAELLRGNLLKSVYHGETGVRTLRELARSYLTTTKDLTRVMSRLKAVYRSWAIPCAGRDVYYTRHRAEWLEKIKHAGVRRRAEHLYEHLDILKQLRQQARRELLVESRKHLIPAKLRQIPCVGPIRSALLVALIQTPHRFRTKRQLWTYSGLALETRISAEYCHVEGQLRRSKKQISIRGLNKDHNHHLKGSATGFACNEATSAFTVRCNLVRLAYSFLSMLSEGIAVLLSRHGASPATRLESFGLGRTFTDWLMCPCLNIGG
jgi:transposase